MSLFSCDLTTLFIAGCMEREIALKTPLDPAKRGQMVAVSAPYSANELAAALAERRVIASPRGDSVRVAFHFYNNESDVQTALEALNAWWQAVWEARAGQDEEEEDEE